MLKKILLVAALSAPFALPAIATEGSAPTKSTKKVSRKAGKKGSKSPKARATVR